MAMCVKHLSCATCYMCVDKFTVHECHIVSTAVITISKIYDDCIYLLLWLQLSEAQTKLAMSSALVDSLSEEVENLKKEKGKQCI